MEIQDKWHLKKDFVVLDFTPSSSVKVNGRFGVTYRLCLQGRRVSQPVLLAVFLLLSCLVY
jgi:hypothetical protein